MFQSQHILACVQPPLPSEKWRGGCTQAKHIHVFQEMALMRDCVRRANFTTKPRLKAKFFAFALFMRGYSFQLYCPGNSFMQNFATLYFENETWW